MSAFRLSRPSADEIDAFIAQQSHRTVTYADVGATRTGTNPRGFRVDHFVVPLGSGDDVFARAKDGLTNWVAHAGAGVDVSPADAEFTPGQTVALVVRLGPAFMLISCRVVWTVDDERAFGFAYGTLPGHPESGEESFVVRRTDDSVVFEVNAISRPLHPMARLGGPITRALQLRSIRGYLRAMQRWVGD